MQFSDEDLIAFLLGDASLELASRIRGQLDVDASLLERLSELRMMLGHLDTLAFYHEPPVDLVASTLARVDAEALNAGEADEPVSHSEPVSLSPAGQPAPTRRRFWDSTVLTLCLSVLCCFALPVLVRARFEARKVQCADNMRRTGSGLIDHTLNAPDQRFPRIATTGRRAFAGLFAIHLNEAGRLDSLHQLHCPSLPMLSAAPQKAGWNTASLGSSVGGDISGFAGSFIRDGRMIGLPSLTELEELSEFDLKICHLQAGGDYAYSLGVLEDSQPVPPRNSGRSYFAILADAPRIRDVTEEFDAHDGAGINILYEDGRVQFLCLSGLYPATETATHQTATQQTATQQTATQQLVDSLVDYPFRNSRGEHQAGVHAQDASLAPSHLAPLGSR